MGLDRAGRHVNAAQGALAVLVEDDGGVDEEADKGEPAHTKSARKLLREGKATETHRQMMFRPTVKAVLAPIMERMNMINQMVVWMTLTMRK